MNVGSGAKRRPALPRLRALTTVGFRAVRFDPRYKHFVNFEIVPIAVNRARWMFGGCAANRASISDRFAVS